MKKRTFSAILSVVLCMVLVLAGCGGKEESKDEGGARMRRKK